MEAFAEDTGYEGTFADNQFLYPSFKNPNQEVYDNFDPYDEEECIIQGSMANRNIYGNDYNDSYGNSNSQDDRFHSEEEPSGVRLLLFSLSLLILLFLFRKTIKGIKERNKIPLFHSVKMTSKNQAKI